MLEVQELRSGYEMGIDVLRGVTVTVESGRIVSVIGSNGAGKSTLLRTISAILKPRGGRILVDGELMSRSSPAVVVRAGVVHVPEGRQVFPNLTVGENLEVGAYLVRDPKAVRRRILSTVELFPELGRRLNEYAGALSGGQQQMLAIGRGLMANPRYILLDEPSLGLAPQVTQRIFQVLDRLRSEGVGILLVEQNGRLALSVSDVAILLERGLSTLEGTGDKLLHDGDVIKRYLGVGKVVALDHVRHQQLASAFRKLGSASS